MEKPNNKEERVGEERPEVKKRKISKILAIEIIFVIAVASIIGGVIIYANMPKGGTLIVGSFGFGPDDIEPLQSVYNEEMCQITEGLFAYDLSDSNLRIVPNLATGGTWNADETEYTVSLRQGVSFHDGTPFNAEAVKWNFDRLYSLIYYTDLAYLYAFPDWTYIIDETQIVDDYTVKFVLNGPFAPFQSLLCFSASYILSPSSTPSDDFIYDIEELVGTGPFIFDSYDSDIPQVEFVPNSNYWGGKPAIDRLVFHYIGDADSLRTALLNGEIHINSDAWFWYPWGQFPAYFDEYEADGLVVSEVLTTKTEYLWMNNRQIPLPMRKAISYAIDYDYIIEEIMGNIVRARSPIPEGILYANWDFEVPILNLPLARQTLIDSELYGSLPPVDDDTSWNDLTTNNPLVIYNYTYNNENPIREAVFFLLQENLAEIGVKITAANMSWMEYLFRFYDIGEFHKNMLQLWLLPWYEAYNDPYLFINPLFSEASYDNFPQFYDSQVQEWMEEALRETDSMAREILYDNIQQRLIEDLYPAAWVGVHMEYHAWVPNLRGFHPNVLGIYEYKKAYLV